MDRVLTTREATVQTVQVEIKALKVGKKQVTMGLFRQLPHDILVDPETVQLRGVPWGYVRYHWEGDGRDFRNGPYMHIVWQLGDELRRSVVYQTPPPERLGEFSDEVQMGIEDWIVVQLAFAETATIPLSTYARDYPVTLDGKAYRVTFEAESLRLLQTYWMWRNVDPAERATGDLHYFARSATPADYAEQLASVTARHQRDKAEAIHGYRKLIVQRGLAGKTTQDILRLIQETQKREADYKARWAQQWQVLSALPQLFIAV